MTSMNLSCTICSENFTSSDEIFSTSCGHVFHNNCLRDWQSRSSTCPDCRSENPETFKIYLHIEDPPAPERTSSQADLEMKISSLEYQLEQSDGTAFDFEIQLSRNEEEMKALKTELDYRTAQLESKEFELIELKSQFENSEENFLNILNKNSTNEEIIKDQQVKIDYLNLCIQNKDKEKNDLKAQHDDIDAQLKESIEMNSKLQNELEGKENAIDDLTTEMKNLKMPKSCTEKAEENVDIQSAMNEKIKVLQEKLRQMTSELDKEIRHSTLLTVDNIKLRNILSLNSSEKEKQEIAIQSEDLRKTTANP